MGRTNKPKREGNTIRREEEGEMEGKPMRKREETKGLDDEFLIRGE